MKKKSVRPLFLVGCLIGITCVAMAYSTSGTGVTSGTNVTTGIVTLSGHLAQHKVLSGADGTVTLSLTMSADDVLDLEDGDARPVDLVIVLDRSGSMRGKKIADAKQAILSLLSRLSAKDRLALVSYSDRVRRHANLLKVTPTNRMLLSSAIAGIWANGGTNLGAGLQEGLNVLQGARRDGHVGKLILISDGLANQGITDPTALSHMASIAVEKEFAVSTAGVGNEFNEQLMTAIANRGAGRYYYLEEPAAFAAVFQREFHNARAVAATGVEVRVPLKQGILLVDAGGYPIDIQNNQAIFHPVDLLSGERRKLFLTLRVPTGEERVFELSGIGVRYCYKGSAYTAPLAESLTIACVKDQQDVFASIDKDEWEEKVLRDDYNRLREEVAADIKDGNEKEALSRIEHYTKKQESINAVVGSSEVATNLDRDVEDLRAKVKDTFQGAPQEVEQKQRRNAKVLQYEGYVGRRSGS
ncbi:MAG: VWA domain-containing protein [Deltaproteobacteria bacterium]|nr:VWA domain-containing protein [Deltaproteobacteria bacterium]